MFLRLLSHAAIEFREPEVGVCHERSHAELACEDECFAETGLSLWEVGGLSTGMDSGDLVQCGRLDTASFRRSRELEGLTRVAPSVVRMSSEAMKLAELAMGHRSRQEPLLPENDLERFLDEGDALRQAPCLPERYAEASQDVLDPVPIFSASTKSQRRFEHWYSGREVPLLDVQQAETSISRVLRQEAKRFFPALPTFAELSLQAQEACEPGARRGREIPPTRRSRR
jgi:hypothetical protein